MTYKNRQKNNFYTGVATAALALAMGMNASAQDAPETVTTETGDEIVVTGIRQSIKDSLAVKKNSTSIVEAITSEDIGKLPDVSIADSLARLPGVTAQRVRGRAQQISIRGLGPDFSIALLNGREQVSAGNNRGIEFDQFPSELIAQGIVYKTPDARLAATGVAGAVDLRTVRPLDYSERKMNLSAKYVVNDSGKLNPDFSADGYRLFGSYIDQNDDGTIGFSLGITHQSNPTHFTSRELKTGPGQTAQLADGTYYAADNPRTGVVSRDFKRTSVAGTLQFEPSERFSATIDGYYSDFEDQGIFRGVETPLASWSGNSLTNSTGSGDFVDSATYAPTAAILRTDTEGNTAEIFSIGGNFQFEVSDRLNFEVDLATSSLDKSDVDYESYAGTGQGILFGPNSADPSLRGSMTYNTPAEGDYSIDSEIDYTNPANVLLTDPGGWGQVGFIKEPQIKDDLNQLRAEAEYELDKGILSSVAAGIIYTDREKSFNSNEGFLREGSVFSNGTSALPNNLGNTDTGSIGLDIIAYDPSELISAGVYQYEAANSVAWVVEEKITTLYGMLNLDSQGGSVPVRGNIGLQYVDVDQSSTGTLAGVGEQTLGDSYSHWLPSANLSFEVADDTFIRAAAAKTVTRPRLDQMTANQSINVNSLVCQDTDMDGFPDTVNSGIFDPQSGNACFNLSGGNPALRPYKSTSFDIAFEKYLDDDTAISIAGFHKNVDDWVVGRNIVVDATQQITDAGFGGVLATAPEIAQVSFNSQENFESAKITGIEATIRSDLDSIVPIEGFGVEASYTYADASLEDGNGNVIDIPGYSENVWSGSIYYENHGWRARVNTRYRSGFLSEVQLFDGSLIGADALSETIVDAQLGYEWDSGALEGFSINLEAYNITDEPFRTENDLDGSGSGTGTFISRYEQYGTTYNITVAKKF